MALRKPPSIADSPFKSAKWDEITDGRDFGPEHVPTITLLVQWYAVMQRCVDDIDDLGGQVAYQNDVGDLKPLPQIATMKQASAEIRQLNKQLGITDTVSRSDDGRSGSNVLSVVIGRRAERMSGAAS